MSKKMSRARKGPGFKDPALLERAIAARGHKRRPRAEPLIGCVQHDCAACRRLAAAAKLENAVVDELLTAIERAEADIGGSRSAAAIIGDLGPAYDALKSALEAYQQES